MATARIGLNTADTHSGFQDTQLVQLSPTTNFSAFSELEATRYAAGDHRLSLVRPTGISAVNDAAVLSAVSLFLHLEDAAGAATAYRIQGRRVLRDWLEAEATWNAFRSGAGNSWSFGGAQGQDSDRVAAASLLSGVVGTTPGWVELVGDAQAIADVQAMILGTLPISGWVLERSDGLNDYAYRKFASSKGADGFRPYLLLTYTIPSNGISNVNGNDTARSDQVNVPINGANFGPTQGSGTVTLRYSTRSVTLPVKSWSDTQIVVDMALGQIPFGPGPFVRVVTNGGTTYNRSITFLPPAGHAYVWLTSIAPVEAERLVALANLPVGGMVWYCGPGGTAVPTGLEVEPDGRHGWGPGTTEGPWLARLWDPADEAYQASFALQYYTNDPPAPNPGGGGAGVVVATGRPLRAAGPRMNWRR